MPPKVPNVCFHGVGTPGRTLEPGEAGYWVTRDRFLEILDLLAADGRATISFDDGNASDVEIALPALRERGLSATFFLLAGRLDQRGSVSREGARQLVEGGMSVGTHGMNHRPWRHMDSATKNEELSRAREVLAEVAQRNVDEAALPLGRYDRALLKDLKARGYSRVHSSDRRWATAGAWMQPRFSVRSTDGVASVRADMLTPQPPVMRLVNVTKGVVKSLR